MAERIKDAEDRFLESIFESAVIDDDGFSAKVVRKVRRRLWLRRLTLPVAAAVGGAVAIKPLAGFVKVLLGLLSVVPQDLVGGATDIIPQMQLIVLGGMLLVVCLVGLRMLED